MTVAKPDADPHWHSWLGGPRAAVLLMCAFGAGWAIIDNVVARHLHQNYDLMQVVWMRYLVHLIIVLLLWGWYRPSRFWRTKRPAYQLTRSVMMLIMPLSFAVALTSGLSVSLVWLLFWLSPIMVICIAVFWLNESPLRVTWLAAGLGLLGVVAVLVPAVRSTSSLALVVPLVAGLSFSVYVAMTRSLRTESIESRMFYTGAGVFAVLTPFVPLHWIMPSWHDIPVIVAVGSFGFVALLLLDRSVSHAPVSATSPALYSQVACASVINMLASGQRGPGHVLVGLLLIVAAGALAWAWPGQDELTQV
jgi:drug/metabolite transporter (DMT)-like permease